MADPDQEKKARSVGSKGWNLSEQRRKGRSIWGIKSSAGGGETRPGKGFGEGFLKAFVL